MILSHQSQIKEWLPFVDSLNDPEKALYKRGPNGENLAWNEKEWCQWLEERFHTVNLRFGFDDCRDREYFAMTGWGYVATKAKLAEDFPFLAWNPVGNDLK